MITALYRRYRPDSFQEVIGQSQVTAPLMAALRNNRTAHAYLFSGPRGCGKTTSARILARCLNCATGPTDIPCGKCESCIELACGGSGSLDVVEMDAASHGGVDDARDIREKAAFAPVRDKYKIFIIDEAHMVSNQGFNALLKLVEEPPEHVKFIFATTEPEKVIGTIRSRTHHYPFRLVAPDILQNYLVELCNREDVKVENGVLPLVVRAGGGSVRDTLSVLDQLMAGQLEGQLSYKSAVGLLGFTDDSLLDDTIEGLAAQDGKALFEVVDKVINSGHDPRRFMDDLLQRLRDVLILAIAGPEGETVLGDLPPTRLERLVRQANALGGARASRSADLVNNALMAMVGPVSGRTHLEIIMARMLLPGAVQGAEGFAARLDALEAMLSQGGVRTVFEKGTANGFSGQSDEKPQIGTMTARQAIQAQIRQDKTKVDSAAEENKLVSQMRSAGIAGRGDTAGNHLRPMSAEEVARNNTNNSPAETAMNPKLVAQNATDLPDSSEAEYSRMDNKRNGHSEPSKQSNLAPQTGKITTNQIVSPTETKTVDKAQAAITHMAQAETIETDKENLTADSHKSTDDNMRETSLAKLPKPNDEVNQTDNITQNGNFTSENISSTSKTSATDISQTNTDSNNVAKPNARSVDLIANDSEPVNDKSFTRSYEPINAETNAHTAKNSTIKNENNNETISNSRISSVSTSATVDNGLQINAATLRNRWNEVLASLHRIKIATWTLVSQNASVAAVNGTTVTLLFKTPGLAKACSSEAHVKALQVALQDALGIQINVRSVAEDGTTNFLDHNNIGHSVTRAVKTDADTEATSGATATHPTSRSEARPAKSKVVEEARLLWDAFKRGEEVGAVASATAPALAPDFDFAAEPSVQTPNFEEEPEVATGVATAGVSARGERQRLVIEGEGAKARPDVAKSAHKLGEAASGNNMEEQVNAFAAYEDVPSEEDEDAVTSNKVGEALVVEMFSASIVEEGTLQKGTLQKGKK